MAAPLPSGSFLMLNSSTNSIGLWSSGSFTSFSGAPEVNASPPDAQSPRAKKAAAPPYLVDLMKVFGWTVTSGEDDAAVYGFPGGSTSYSAADAFEKFACDAAKNGKTLTSRRSTIGQAEVNGSSAIDGERSASRSGERNSLPQGEGPAKEVSDSSKIVRERSAARSRERTSFKEGENPPTKNVDQTEVNDSPDFDRERSRQRIRERTSLTSLTEGEGPSRNVNQAEVNVNFASAERSRERTSLGNFSQIDVDDSSPFDRERSGQKRRERTSLGRSATNGKTSLNDEESPSKKVRQAVVNENSTFDRERSALRSREITSLGKSALDSSKNGKTILGKSAWVSAKNGNISLTEGEGPPKNANQSEVNGSSAFDRERDAPSRKRASLTEDERPSKKVHWKEVDDSSSLSRKRSRERISFGKSALDSEKNGKANLTEEEGPSKRVKQKEVNDSSDFDRERSVETTSLGKSAWVSAKNGNISLTEGDGPPKNVSQSKVNGSSSAFDRERSALSRERASLTEDERPSKKVHWKEADDSSSLARKRSRERISFGKSALDSEKNGKANVMEEEGPSKRVKRKEVNDSSDSDRERSVETIRFRNGKTSLTEGEGPSKVNQEVNASSAFARERSTGRISFGKSSWDFQKTGKTSLTEGDNSSKKVNQMKVGDSFTCDRERRSSERSRERSSPGKSAWDSQRNWKTDLTSKEGPWKKVNQTEINGFATFGRERNSLGKFAWDSAKNAKTSLTEVNDCSVLEREKSLEIGKEGTLASPSTEGEESGRKRSWNKVNPSTEVNEQSAKKKQKRAKELTLPTNSGTDGDKRVDSPPLTLGNNCKSKDLTMQEAPIEEQRRSFKRTDRTRRRGSNTLVEPVQGRRKSQRNNCSFTRELTLREKSKEVDFERKMTTLSWLIDSGALTENELLVHKVNARGLATREGILCGCCKKTMFLSEFDCHAGGDRSQPLYNISLTSGKLLIQCHLEAWEKEKKTRNVDFLTVHGGSDPSDDSCGVCAEGGHLICCDNCPSTFHQDCLKLEKLPEGKWFCPYCTCMLCSVSKGMNDTSSLFTCQQCSCKYHWQCTRESRVTEKLAQSLLFCGEDCKGVDDALFDFLARENEIGEGFSWSLLKRLEEQETVNSKERLSLTMECNGKLSMVAKLYHECFIPMVDLRTGVDLISRAVFNCGSNLKRVDCAGFYTIVLEKGQEIISAATIRFHGRGVAEMPFIGTRPVYSRQGMCRRLFGAIEKLLLTLRVKKLLIPAAPELVGTWVDSFSFNLVEKSDNWEIRNLGLLTFPETILLEKSITVTR